MNVEESQLYGVFKMLIDDSQDYRFYLRKNIKR